MRLARSLLFFPAMAVAFAAAQIPPEPLWVPEKAQKAKLVASQPAIYPPLAEQARIEGVVRLQVAVARDGSLKAIEVISGHPLLVGSALDSVRSYRYQPTLVNGQPVEVVTSVRVRFSLEGDEQQILANRRKAVAKRPNDAKVHAELADWLSELGEIEEAEGEYRKALALGAKDQRTHYGLAEVVAERGDFDGAVAIYRSALQLKPNDRLGHYRLAELLHRKGDLDATIAEYRVIIQLTGGDSGAYNNLGVALREKGQLDEAIAAFRESLKRGGKPGDHWAHYELGVTLELKAEFEEAFEHYRKAHKAFPQNPKFRAAYERLATKLGKK